MEKKKEEEKRGKRKKKKKKQSCHKRYEREGGGGGGGGECFGKEKGRVAQCLTETGSSFQNTFIAFPCDTILSKLN